MATKKATEILTPSTVRRKLDESMLRAFRRLQIEQELETEHATATYAGLSSTYVHWVTYGRPWPIDAIVLVATALNCLVPEMLRLAGDGRETGS